MATTFRRIRETPGGFLEEVKAFCPSCSAGLFSFLVEVVSLCGISHKTLLLDFLVLLPVTDEVLLVEDGTIGAEEGVGEEATVHVPQSAHVESLEKAK